MNARRYVDHPLPLRAATLALALFAYFGVYRPGEDERLALASQTAENLTRARLAQDALAHADAYVASARAIERELRSVRVGGDEGEATAALLVDLDRAARARRVDFTGLEPQRGAAGAEGLSLLVHARGRYGDVMHYCGDLVLARDLLELEAVDFARDARTVRAGASPVLDAVIRVTLLKASPSSPPSPKGAI